MLVARAVEAERRRQTLRRIERIDDLAHVGGAELGTETTGLPARKPGDPVTTLKPFLTYRDALWEQYEPGYVETRERARREREVKAKADAAKARALAEEGRAALRELGISI